MENYGLTVRQLGGTPEYMPIEMFKYLELKQKNELLEDPVVRIYKKNMQIPLNLMQNWIEERKN